MKPPKSINVYMYLLDYYNNNELCGPDGLTNVMYVLSIRSTLCAPSMKHNLVTPFIMREAGIEVRDTPKIQDEDPSVEDHYLYLK